MLFLLAALHSAVGTLAVENYNIANNKHRSYRKLPGTSAPTPTQTNTISYLCFSVELKLFGNSFFAFLNLY